ncbi:MAG: DNA repair protein RecO [Rikenellaceae bacterium]|nr:DNA repair protein RecO [Rikenellaceae bacterium]
MKSYKAKGIVLSTVKYGDSSLILFLYTNIIGRQTYIVQGIRSKGKGNKSSFFQPLFPIDFIGYEPRYGSMHKIKEVALAYPVVSLPFDIRKSTVSLFIAETIYRLIRESVRDERLFDFVYNSVVALDSMNDGVYNFHLWFLVKLSYFLGFYPGNEYMPDSYFDITNGVFTPVMPPHQMLLNRENSELLGIFMDVPIDEIHRINLSGSRRSAFLNSILIFIGYHSDSVNKIKSIDILREVF